MSQDVKPKSSSSFHFIAGLTTGTLSALLLQPADLLKTRLQQSRTTTLLPTLRLILVSPRPIAHLWRGTLPSVIRTGLGSALYFSSLNALRQHLAFSPLLPSTALITPPNANNAPKARQYSSSTLPHLSNTANLVTGAIARASAGLALTPITVLKVRYESNLYAYSSLWSASRAIWLREGAKGFFAGWGATAVRDAPYAGLYVVFYEQGKRRLSALQGGDMGHGRSVGINFTSGVVAAGLATAMTNPFDAVKTRLQLMPGKYGNMIQATAKMVKEDGVRTLFGGLGLRMARKAASSALAWTLYEELVRRAEGKWEKAVV